MHTHVSFCKILQFKSSDGVHGAARVHVHKQWSAENGIMLMDICTITHKTLAVSLCCEHSIGMFLLQVAGRACFGFCAIGGGRHNAHTFSENVCIC